ncbi:hypothetical protein HNQ07_004524 [Deinococcus metalli]|nr:hypothetical protein [Deinococcus metalli]MBB5379014.1 hypothetical protein [Deinococcus metalli]
MTGICVGTVIHAVVRVMVRDGMTIYSSVSGHLMRVVLVTNAGMARLGRRRRALCAGARVSSVVQALAQVRLADDCGVVGEVRDGSGAVDMDALDAVDAGEPVFQAGELAAVVAIVEGHFEDGAAGGARCVVVRVVGHPCLLEVKRSRGSDNTTGRTAVRPEGDVTGLDVRCT